MTTTDLRTDMIAGFPALRTVGEPGRPPLLFLHGAFVDHRCFGPWIEIFAAKGWSCIAPSRRGRLGVGPEHARNLTVADYVDDTLAVIGELEQLPVVIGHSLGALVAQKVAESGKCAAALLVSPAPPAMLPAQPVAVPTYLAMLPKILAGLPVLPARGGCATIALNRVPRDLHAAIHGALIPESGKVYREMIFGRIRVDPGRVTCPVRVISGAEDRIVSPALARWTAAYYGAEAVICDGHAHWLLGEPGFEAIAAGAEAWIASLFPAGRTAERHRAA
jgi:non-heme chloroperoxidase